MPSSAATVPPPNTDQVASSNAEVRDPSIPSAAPSSTSGPGPIEGPVSTLATPRPSTSTQPDTKPSIPPTTQPSIKTESTPQVDDSVSLREEVRVLKVSRPIQVRY